MAKVTNALTTYGVVGNREDLSNAIYNIDPFDTPIMSASYLIFLIVLISPLWPSKENGCTRKNEDSVFVE